MSKQLSDYMKIRPHTLQKCSAQDAMMLKDWMSEIMRISRKPYKITDKDRKRVAYLSECIDGMEKKYAEQGAVGGTAKA